MPLSGPCLVLGADRWRLLHEIASAERGSPDGRWVRRDAEWTLQETRRWLSSVSGASTDLFGDPAPSAYVLDLLLGRPDDSVLKLLAESSVPGLWLWGSTPVLKAWSHLPVWHATPLTARTLGPWLAQHAAPTLTRAWPAASVAAVAHAIGATPEQPGRVLQALLQLDGLLDPSADLPPGPALSELLGGTGSRGAATVGDAEGLIWRDGGQVAAGGPSAGPRVRQWMETHRTIRRLGGRLTPAQARALATWSGETPRETAAWGGRP